MAAVSNVNMYALLDDSEATDPAALVSDQPKQKTDRKKPVAKSSATTESGAIGDRVAARMGEGSRAQPARGGRRGGRGRGPGGRAPRAQYYEDDQIYEGGGGRTSYGRGRGGRGRGGRGGRGQREYDRHDGTGRGHEGAKRAGHGRGNWGGEDQEREFAADASAPVDGEMNGEQDDGTAVDGMDEVAEQTEKLLTLDEYDQELAGKQSWLQDEGEVQEISQEQFKGMTEVEKGEVELEDDFLNLVSVKDKKDRERIRKEKSTESNLLRFRVGDETADAGRKGPGRGGRNKGPGGRRPDRGGDRVNGESSGYNDSNAHGGVHTGGQQYEGGYASRSYGGRGRGRGGRVPNMADQNSFPTLGS